MPGFILLPGHGIINRYLREKNSWGFPDCYKLNVFFITTLLRRVQGCTFHFLTNCLAGACGIFQERNLMWLLFGLFFLLSEFMYRSSQSEQQLF